MGVLNYAYNLFLNRLFVPADYATYVALMGLLAIITVPVSALQAIAAKYAAEYRAAKKTGLVRQLLWGLTRRVLPVGLIAFVVFMLAPKLVAEFLGAGKADSVILAVKVMGTAFLLQVLLPINRGLLQGLQNFASLSFNFALDAISRFGIGLLIFLPLLGGFSWPLLHSVLNGSLKLTTANAVALGIAVTIIGSSLAYLVSFWPLRKLPKNKATGEDIDSKDILRFSWPTLLMFVFLAILFNVDVVLVKHFSGPGLGISLDNAGEYATISTLAKIVYFITGPIIAVMFPMISDLVGRGEKHFKLLLLTLFTVLSSALVVLGVFAALPNTVVGALTPNYISVANLLVPMTVIFVVYSLVNLMSNYYLSIRQYGFIWPLGFFALMEVILINFFHGSMMEVIKSAIMAQTLLLFVFMLLYLSGKKNQLQEIFRRYE